jgi:hypothetical protein
MTTRFERIRAELSRFDLNNPSSDSADEATRRILAIADSRELWTPAECAAYIGREQPVWANWQRRQSHDVPAPAFRTSSGAMYDAEDVREWARDPQRYALLGEDSPAVKYAAEDSLINPAICP